MNCYTNRGSKVHPSRENINIYEWSIHKTYGQDNQIKKYNT